MDPVPRQQHGRLQPKAQMQPTAVEPIAVGLTAAILAVHGNEPVVAVVPARPEARDGGGDALPCGLFSPRLHGTLEAALCTCVKEQTGIELGHARQICTLGACHDAHGGTVLHVVAVCYLALVAPSQIGACDSSAWRSWYSYFPWEDWRRGRPACLAEDIEPRLEAWARLTPAHCEAKAPPDALDRSQRVRIAFGRDGVGWDGERTLERYELLREAGLLGDTAAGSLASPSRPPRLWHPMLGDHAGVLANAIGEVRRSVKCRPVIFELMPDLFTLFELQKTVEAILGPHLHKQNFRRLVETGGLVEPTGEFRFRTGGRPAQLYRFRRDVMLERRAPGVRIKPSRG